MMAPLWKPSSSSILVSKPPLPPRPPNAALKTAPSWPPRLHRRHRQSHLPCASTSSSSSTSSSVLLRGPAEDMDIGDDQEEPPPFLEHSNPSSRPRRIALFVEPSPFAYVSGYKNRFQNFIRYLREMGDEVRALSSSFPIQSSPIQHCISLSFFICSLHSTYSFPSRRLPQVIVVTTHEGVPQEFYGAKLIGSWRYSPPLID